SRRPLRRAERRSGRAPGPPHRRRGGGARRRLRRTHHGGPHRPQPPGVRRGEGRTRHSRRRMAGGAGTRRPMIRFESVSKTYPDGTTAVEDLDLEVPTGSLTVFVGPSGCGKTTSMRMINRMVEPTAGRILVDGEDIADTPTVRLRQSMGYVLQGAGLFPHRTPPD